MVLALFAGFSLVIAALAFITSVWTGVALLAVLGVGDGYVAVVMITLVQRMTPTAMLGRVMSLVMLAMLGVTPVSQVAAGAIIGFGPAVLFVGSGAAMLVVAVVAAARRHSWSIDALEGLGALAAENA